jgi:molybdenum cofactor guanylyltransferase
MSDVSVAILTGGRAARFGGRDKSALVIDGRSILDRQLEAMSPLADDVMIVGASDRAERATRAPAPSGTVRHLADIVPGSGPLGGIHAALSAARSDAVLVLACDMPYVSTAFAAYLVSLADRSHIVVPRSGDGYHPLCAVYPRTLVDTIARLLAERRLALHELLAVTSTRVVVDEEMCRFGAPPRLLANVNTPAEYAALEALQDHKP